MGSKINGRLEDHFSSKVESLWKDVECVFGILKGRSASLDKGFKYLDVKTCGHIFMISAVLHNMMLSEMVRESKPPRLQWGVHLASSGTWLERPLEIIPVPGTDYATKLKMQLICGGCSYVIIYAYGRTRSDHNNIKLLNLF
jgi:hypothetical protein